jgi:glycosyltransferase involved in cell wall biosynthesis
VKVAFVSQGLDEVLPPRQNSVGLCTYSLSRHFPSDWDRVVYSAGGTDRQSIDHDGVRFVTLPVSGIDRLFRKAHSWYRRIVSRLTDGDHPKPFSASLGCYPHYMLRVARELRRECPSVIHIQHGFQYAPLVKILNRRSKVVVQFQAGWTPQNSIRSARRRLHFADAVVGVSGFITDGLLKAFPESKGRIFTIHDGVEPSEFPCEPEAVTTSNILYAGQVSPHKGVHDLIDAFVLLASDEPSATLRIVGPQGAYPLDEVVSREDTATRRLLAPFYSTRIGHHSLRGTPDYMALLRHRIPPDLVDRITFAGHVTRQELLANLRSARVFAFTPIWDEGFGLPPVEAMASGTPVVATRSGAVVETVIDGVTGFLVEKGDVEELSHALLRLLREDELRNSMGASARAEAMRRFSWAIIAAQASRAYLELLSVDSSVS